MTKAEKRLRRSFTRKRYNMTRSQRVLAACKELKLEVFGLDLEVKTNTQKRVKLDRTKGSKPEDVLKAFCESENVAGSIKQTGLELLK